MLALDCVQSIRVEDASMEMDRIEISYVGTAALGCPGEQDLGNALRSPGESSKLRLVDLNTLTRTKC